jgi:Mrp family chromosome partitioning ATPase
MSRNFELLRKARKGQELFIQPPPSWPAENDSVAGFNEKTVHTESIVDRKKQPPHPISPGRQSDGVAQEEIAKLVRTVFVFPNSHAPRVVSFSSIEGAGSSEICRRAAESLASEGSQSVCLVDGNFHAPSLHHLLGVRQYPGLTESLINPGSIKEYAVPIGSEKLWFLPPGYPSAEVQGLFASDRLGLRVTELREQFDFVLIDLPPICASADAVLLGHLTDGVILVLEANSTRRETARMAKQTLEAAQVKLLGAILNNRTFPIPEILYRRL